MLAHKPYASSGATADDGSYTLDLPSGKYFVVAKKRAAGVSDGPLAVGDGFSYNGSNPITVDPGSYVHVGFNLSRKLADVQYRDGLDPATGSLEGVIEYGGKPLEGAGPSAPLPFRRRARGTVPLRSRCPSEAPGSSSSCRPSTTASATSTRRRHRS